jgi:hypothetical protein
MAFEQAGRPFSRTLLSSQDVLPLVKRENKYYLPRATVLTSFFLLSRGLFIQFPKRVWP